jgi:putative FmdB family regulatory protein
VPLYEYECDNNGHRFEVIQKFSDPPVQVCPKCGSPVHKMISSPAFQFKGTGWYITDYARKDSGGGKGSESGEKEKTESKDKAAATDSEKDSGAKKTESTGETKSSIETKGSTKGST